MNMTERDKEIVKKYLDEKPTYKALGKEYDISGERIRQIIEKFARKANHLYQKKKNLERWWQFELSKRIEK